MVRVAPSILSADFGRLLDEVRRVERGGADIVHVDVMDGQFVPNISVGIPIVEALRGKTTLPIDVHLMITNPQAYIQRFAEAGANMLSFHVETCAHAQRAVQAIRASGVKAGVALNPSTPLCFLDYLLGELDFALLMAVNPGFSGQEFIPAVLGKISELRQAAARRGVPLEIEVDGGINNQTGAQAVRAGATILVAASFVFGARDAGAAIRQLKMCACTNGAPGGI